MNVKNSSQNTVKKYEELTFTDDFMFCKVMQNNPDLCKHLIDAYHWQKDYNDYISGYAKGN